MNECELYYRRGFNLINELIDIYKNGYSEEKLKLFSYKRKLKKLENYSITSKEDCSFIFTSLIALLGLNKENLEETGKNTDYLSFIPIENFVSEDNLLIRNIYARFNDSRKVFTGCDEWLSVIQNLDSNNDNVQYLKKVRNSLLHSHFEPLDNFITKVWNNNWSGFQGYVLNYNFFQLIISYFGNTAGMGLKDKCLIYFCPEDLPIDSSCELDAFLKQVSISNINYTLNDSYKGYNSLESKLRKITSEDESLNKDKFERLIRKAKKYGINITSIGNKTISDDVVQLIKDCIYNIWGEAFFNMDYNDKKSIIVSLCQYIYDNHSLISNWILHFMYVVGGFNNRKFIEKDYLVNFCSLPSLLLVKAYHLLYRLQHDNFMEIDYNLIDFDLSLDDFYFYEQNDLGCMESTFQDDFNKLRIKRPDLSIVALKNKIITDIIRDALAHGNVEISFAYENGNLKHIIEFQDVYKNNIRGIQMTIDKFDKFLKSEAFLLRYCLLKADTRDRTL